MKKLKKMLHERREEPRKEESDFFDFVVEELSKEGTLLNEEIALDLMFSLLFASFETTSLALTYAIKALSDHPSVLKRLEVCQIYMFCSYKLLTSSKNFLTLIRFYNKV